MYAPTGVVPSALTNVKAFSHPSALYTSGVITAGVAAATYTVDGSLQAVITYRQMRCWLFKSLSKSLIVKFGVLMGSAPKIGRVNALEDTTPLTFPPTVRPLQL